MHHTTRASRFLGLIPARGGSKRLPHKNVLPMGGRPLLAWTIEAARGAKLLDRVVLSTEDEQIAAIGRDYGADVPFVRPTELASDTATSFQVVEHALLTLQGQGQQYDFVVVLQPTSPLRTSSDIDDAINLLLEKHADSVTSVCETDHPAEWVNSLPDDRSMTHFYGPGVRATRSQDLPTRYQLNGALYVFNCRRLLDSGTLVMDDRSYAYVMPRERSVDIDSALDFEIAQLLLQRFGKNSA